MARTVTTSEADQHFPDLLASAEAGEETVIVRHGKPVARLVPVSRPEDETTLAERLAAFDELAADIEKHGGHGGGNYVFRREDAYEDD